jgi:NADP-dependent 3-hydroxy acid dehydrogenase YdfG
VRVDDSGEIPYHHLKPWQKPLAEKEKTTMKEFRDKIAVITGAASGIGRAIAKRCASEGMKVVLADIEESALVQTESEIKSAGASVLSVVTDVSKIEDVKTLAQKTLDTFGAVHLLCNNAGVGAGSTAWETTINDWKWTLGVNLWGVIHGIQVFIPIMLAQDAESHIVNTSSIAGLLPYQAGAAYHATKHAVVAISEKLYYDLAEKGGKVKVSVLCPGWVRTRILDAWRNRPAELQDDVAELVITPEMEAVIEEYQRAVETGMSPHKVAERVFQSIIDDQFYIVTHPEFMPIVKARMEAITQGHNPLSLEKLIAMLGE